MLGEVREQFELSEGHPAWSSADEWLLYLKKGTCISLSLFSFTSLKANSRLKWEEILEIEF